MVSVHRVHERSEKFEILRFYGGGGCTWPTCQLTAGANWGKASLKTVKILLEILYKHDKEVGADAACGSTRIAVKWAEEEGEL